MSELKDKNHIKDKPEEENLTHKNNKYYNPELAAYARKLAEEVRRTQPPFDRAKFEELLDTDPLLSYLRFLPEDDN